MGNFRGPRPSNNNNNNNIKIRKSDLEKSIVIESQDSESEILIENGEIKYREIQSKSFLNSSTSSSNNQNSNNNRPDHKRCIPNLPFSISIWSLQPCAYLIVTVIEKIAVFKLL